ncbi:hypothetical protein [Pyxidicoccus sp. MSG2]|uniref:hypothetical protein n=1 Tax=Pyxidicoccus sp. MSG2 TaxID=2996790 RepID=UPI00226E72CA|nr:hypothetical protein [Pyxidicoccus sp. MSG2]MCY1020332.1 hypothetical protein [Pyxidicoccus sp. MSG2]
MASLDEVRDDYCDENLPVLLLLGLVSALRRLDPLLPPPGAPPERPEPEVGRDVHEERFLYLVLGLIAFRGHLRSALTPICDAGPRAASTGAVRAEVPAAPVPRLRELLR